MADRLPTVRVGVQSLLGSAARPGPGDPIDVTCSECGLVDGESGWSESGMARLRRRAHQHAELAHEGLVRRDGWA